jgi:flagellar hook-associated protein 3 FlgL
VTDLIERVRELTVQAGNGALSADDRNSIASELRQRLDQLATLGNSRDASGEYIFSGFKGNTPAFGQNISGDWVYQGDEGQRSLEIDTGVKVAISDTGKEIFTGIATGEPTFFASASPANNSGGRISTGVVLDQSIFNDFYGGSTGNTDDVVVDINADAAGVLKYELRFRSGDPADPAITSGVYESGESISVAGIQFEITDAQLGDRFEIQTSEKQSMFTSIEKLIYGLENQPTATPASDQQAFEKLIASSIVNLDNSLEKVLVTQTEIGGRLNALESTREFLADSSVYTDQIRSELRDVDYAEAVSRLSFQSFVLEAAQLSFAQVSRLSLFVRL